jgi:hypothetical protein
MDVIEDVVLHAAKPSAAKQDARTVLLMPVTVGLSFELLES